MSTRQHALCSGWLRADDALLAPRLAWPATTAPDMVHEFNRPARDRIVARMLDRTYQPCSAPPLFGPEDEAVVGETDRYGIPFRTLLGLQTGMLRADPYFADEDLPRFYRDEYRRLNRGKRFSHGWFFGEQVKRGQQVLDRLSPLLAPGARVCDVGCGMGGMLIPFSFEGFSVIGCDYGEEYAARGRGMGIDIRIGGFESVADQGPFDVILLSHVIQHVPDPLAFLSATASLLRPGGICYVELPGLLNLRQWYAGDLMQYFQNANRWHFTAATLNALLSRAGLSVVSCDEAIACVARPARIESSATPGDGPRVLAEIRGLEAKLWSMAQAA